jgi:hypothetical protein
MKRILLMLVLLMGAVTSAWAEKTPQAIWCQNNVSDRPFQGVNIVVTEYTDGTSTTSKMFVK